MVAVSVRYIVDDVEASIGFYTEHLGFLGRCASVAPVRDPSG
jgi:catechol 2,3-dioxygenase-like lactoylglutathione lyase family enzyme